MPAGRTPASVPHMYTLPSSEPAMTMCCAPTVTKSAKQQNLELRWPE